MVDTDKPIDLRDSTALDFLARIQGNIREIRMIEAWRRIGALAALALFAGAWLTNAPAVPERSPAMRDNAPHDIPFVILAQANCSSRGGACQ
jgi:hypothetical protein